MTEIEKHFIDDSRRLIVPGDHEQTIIYCTERFIQIAEDAISRNGRFCVALSGGSTPKAIFEKICNPPYSEQINWGKIWLFWSDERSVEPNDPDSNYYMAMKAGFEKMPIPKNQIHRMEAEEHLEKHAEEYNDLIETELGSALFDLVMLGMGDDGHTASLFPNTEGLNCSGKWVTANFVPQKNTWRMTLTYECINQSSNIFIYVLGEKKQDMLKKVLSPLKNKPHYPCQMVGSNQNPAIFIADTSAAKNLFSNDR